VVTKINIYILSIFLKV